MCLALALALAVHASFGPPPPAVHASFGPPPAAPPPRSVLVRTLIVDGDTRTYQVQLPAAAAAAAEEGVPVVFSYHGWCSTAAAQAAADGLRARLGGAAAVVHPEGFSDPTDPRGQPNTAWQSWNGAGSAGVESGGADGPTCDPEIVSADAEGWQCYASCARLGYCSAKGGGDNVCRWSHCRSDVNLTLAILDDLQAGLGLRPDRGRLFATGASNGAMFTYELAADRRVGLAAAAPVSGLPHNGFNRGPADGRTRYLAVEGVADPYVQPFPGHDPGRPDRSFSTKYGWWYSDWTNTTGLWARAKGLPPSGRVALAAPPGAAITNCSGWPAPGGNRSLAAAEVATCFYQGGHRAPDAAWELVAEFFGFPPSPPPSPPPGPGHP